jgi:hypothetical protein
MVKITRVKYLSRYTSISALLCMLESKELRLSNPENWLDRTDAAFLKKYAENEKKEVRALCFFDRYDKNNYWEIYAKYGCMIEFDKKMLFEKIEDSDDFDFRKVKHMNQRSFKFEKHKKDLPFIKQWSYKNEKECRLIWKGSDEKNAVIPVNLKSIRRIVISGDIDEKSVKSLREIIYRITDKAISKDKITHSKLYNNEKWVKKLNLKTQTTHPQESKK